MVVTSDDASKAVWNALYAMFVAEVAKGAGGKLPTVTDVRRSIDFWTYAKNAVGVQLVEFTQKPFSSPRRSQVDMTFYIIAQAVSEPTFDTEVPRNMIRAANLDDANATLDIIEGGSGDQSGITGLLRSPGSFGLVGSSGDALAFQTGITRVQRDWKISPGTNDDSKVFAYSVLTYMATTFVTYS